jgi:exodeoxyribonuclease VIII
MTLPQLIENMPAAEYHAIPAASSTALKTILRQSPLHWITRDIDEDSDALRFGTAVHAALLEPADFMRFYHLAGPRPDGRTKEGKAAKAAAETEAAGRAILWEEEAATIEHIRASIMQLDLGPSLLKGRPEITILWADEGTGCACKARLDLLLETPSGLVIADIKTTARGAGPREFRRTIFDRDYHLQAAWYRRALRAIDCDALAAVWLAVEKSPPYAAATYMASPEMLEAGDRLIDGSTPAPGPLARYAEALRTGDWPGYSTGLLEVPLRADGPPW